MGDKLTKSANGCVTMILVFWVCLWVPGYALAKAQGPLMVGMGDSIGAGVQSADANLWTQRFSYLKLIANQMGARFPLPYVKSSKLGVVGDTIFRDRVYPGIPGLNLSVSGADVRSLVNEWADALDEDEIDSEADLMLFPRIGSQLKIVERIAERNGPPIVICWIGNNNVLSAALSFDELDASQMTSVELFEYYFIAIAEKLGSLGGPVVFANIPDVTRIGFLLDREDLISFVGSDFGLAEGDYTSVVVMLLIRLGLDDGRLLKDPDFVLDAGEVARIQERIEAFNGIIEREAGIIRAPVVDINALFDDADENPFTFFGIPVTPRFLGGIFSLDGVHPSNIAHAVIANAFIETINFHFGMEVPLISDKELERIFLRDPFQDKDGDGRVRGRSGAGLLEALGPVLGISGDRRDWIPGASPAQIDASAGQRFIRRLLKLQREDLGRASEWSKWDVIEVFRRIFRMNIQDWQE
jgi:hypothetical protein